MRMDCKTLARFEAKVSRQPNGGCWLWTGATTRRGYGCIKSGEKIRAAHRVAYEQWVGEIGEGLLLMHSCDDRRCVNPDHLTPGTQLQNMHDMWSKGRGAKGEKNGNSKLTSFGVRYVFDMIAAGKNYAQIARHLDVSKTTISRIARREIRRAG